MPQVVLDSTWRAWIIVKPAAGLSTAELNKEYKRSLIHYKMKNGTQAPAPPEFGKHQSSTASFDPD